MSILGNAAILLGGLYLLSRSDEVQNNCGGNEPGSSTHPVDEQGNATNWSLPGAGPQRPTSAVGERGKRGLGEADRADGS